MFCMTRVNTQSRQEIKPANTIQKGTDRNSVKHSFNTYIQLVSGFRILNFVLKLHVCLYLVHAGSEGSCETVHVRSLT